MAYSHTDGRSVLASITTESDGRQWLHVSVSRRNRLPSWEELREVKELFVGRERVALQVLPRTSEYINVHPFVLHLWAVADDGPDPVPNFAKVRGGTI